MQTQENSPQPITDIQNNDIPLTTPASSPKTSLPLTKILISIIILLSLVIVGGTGYVLGLKKNEKINVEQTTSSIADNRTTLKTQTPGPSSKPVTIPSDWRSFTATDPDFGIKTTMSMPPGYSFAFTGSEFTIQNDSDATELWDYSTSVFAGKDGLKNYYSGQSRRAWYQDLLDGDFMAEKPSNFAPGKIMSAVEHQIGSGTYYELTVSGESANYSGNEGKHFIFVQNGIVHILKPSSNKASTSEAKIPQQVGTIFTSLSSTQTK